MEDLYLYLGYTAGVMFGAVSGITAYYLNSLKKDIKKTINENILPDDKDQEDNSLESRLD